jgi:hypothetical protein
MRHSEEGGTKMTEKAIFTDEEWNLVREGPPAAGTLVLTAQGGGTLRETWALAKTYAEARKQHGESQLLDELVSEKPDLKRYGSAAELEQQGLAGLRQAIEVLERKATPEEVEDYRRFVLEVAQRVAKAHEEEGEPISPAERAAIEKVASTVGTSTP